MSCAHNFNDYYNIIKNTSKILDVNNNITNKLNVNQNNSTIFKTSKCYKLNYEILSQQYFFYFTKLICLSKQLKKNIYKYKIDYKILFQLMLKFFLFNHRQLIHKVSNIENQKKFNRLKSKPFLFLSPKIITEFTKIQMSQFECLKLKQNKFSKNIQVNIMNLIKLLLIEFQHNLLGLKIICSGK
jgi:hypothetical protein